MNVTDICYRLVWQIVVSDYRCGMVGKAIHMYFTNMHLGIRIDSAIGPPHQDHLVSGIRFLMRYLG